MKTRSLHPLLLLPFLFTCARAEGVLEEKIPWAVADVQALQDPDAARLTGWLGQRIDGNEKVRLLGIDTERRLLDCFRNRPGKQEWAGEHAGKWLHAATLAWVNSGDPALRAKIDYVVAELIKCQLPDGYLGTYTPDKYWTSWDLWSHKYNLIGLITYMRYTGDQQPMEACRKMADLLCRTYGDGEGQRTIIQGPHKGLAYSSVMEPMVELYRLTGEPRYLEFCRYILRAWETEKGPKIISGLLTLKQVNKVANGKAYELLSCLNSVLEVYRTTGEKDLLEACLNAWQDIEDNRIYITGTASYRELFRDDHDLPNTNNVGETCVTVTWIQFNQQLLRLTGEARFAQELERVVLNQLIGSQAPDHDGWGYYVQLEGKKPYASAILGHCCLSSGPRGLALIPTFAASTDADGVVVNLYEAGTAKLALRDRSHVTLKTETAYPSDGRIRITVTPSAAANFAVKLRIPEWSQGAPIRINGESQTTATGADGYVALHRAWKAGDVIELAFKMEPRLLVGDHTNTGKAAFLYGPLVLAADDDTLLAPDLNKDLRPLVLPSADLGALGFSVEPAPDKFKTWPGAQVFRIEAGVLETAGDTTTVVPRTIRLVPFGEAGGFGSRYKVWLPLASAYDGNVALQGAGHASARDATGAQAASALTDGELLTAATSSAGAAADTHWFAVEFARPISVRQVSFVHGQNLTKTGWFDSSAGKPEIQVKRTADGPWERVAELADYPATTAIDGSAFKREQKEGLEVSTADIRRVAESRTFIVKLPAAETAVAVRVVGRPSAGTKPDTYGVSAAELAVAVK
ncbi:MAG: glycoside hydrolase family 127 protein [Burkholderiales bacterium]|nr:glycoside hydrolase family 127 protein [Opitutaceae bacterium]